MLSSRLGALPSSVLTPDQMRTIINNPVDALNALSPALQDDVIDAYRRGFRIVFILLAALATFSFFVALAFLKQKKLDRDDDKDLKEQGKQFVAGLKAAKASRNPQTQPNADSADDTAETTGTSFGNPLGGR